MSFLNSGSMSLANKALSSGSRPALATDNVMGQKVNRNKVFASSHGLPLAKPVLIRQSAYQDSGTKSIASFRPRRTKKDHKVFQSWKGISERLKDVLPLVTVNRQKYKVVMEKKKASESKYGSVLLDSKGGEVDPFASEIAVLDDELKVYRKMALTLLGTNKVKVPLIAGIVVSSIVTTGVINAVAPVTAGSLVDFASFAAVFEEYQFTGGEIEGVVGVAAATSITTPANSTTPTLAALSYSTLSAPATSVAQLIDDEQSRLLPLPVIYGGADTMVPTKNWEFRWRTLPGVLTDTSQVSSGNWTLTSNTSAVYGYLRYYGIIASAASVTNAISGVMKIHAEFRMRV